MADEATAGPPGLSPSFMRFCYFEDGEQKGTHDVSELCEECKDKLEKIIKDGFN